MLRNLHTQTSISIQTNISKQADISIRINIMIKTFTYFSQVLCPFLLLFLLFSYSKGGISRSEEQNSTIRNSLSSVALIYLSKEKSQFWLRQCMWCMYVCMYACNYECMLCSLLHIHAIVKVVNSTCDSVLHSFNDL